MKIVRSNKINIIAILMTILGFSLSAFAKGGVGTGGGDLIRSVFLETGKRVIQDLAIRHLGNSLKKSTDVSINDLKKVLTIEKIIVTPHQLYDQTGSLVDSLYYDSKTLQLNDEKWDKNIRDKRDLRKQVFHEMLRLSGFNDDNYVFSGQVYRESTLAATATKAQDSQHNSSTTDMNIFKSFHNSTFVFPIRERGSDQHLTLISSDSKNRTALFSVTNVMSFETANAIGRQLNQACKDLNADGTTTVMQCNLSGLCYLIDDTKKEMLVATLNLDGRINLIFNDNQIYNLQRSVQKDFYPCQRP